MLSFWPFHTIDTLYVIIKNRLQLKKILSQIFKLKLLILVAFFFTIISCNGQNNKVEEGVPTETKKLSQSSDVLSAESSDIRSSELSQRVDFTNQIDNVVRIVYQDSNSKFWFGSENGAFRLDGDVLISIDEITSENGKPVTIKDLKEDSNGNIWFGHTGGISVYDGRSIRNYYESDGLLSNDVWCVSIDKNNHVWIGTIEGVCKFDGQNFTAYEIPEGIKDPSRGVSSKKMIHNIMEDSSGRLWFSTNGGVYIKDGDLLTNISEKNGLKTSFVNTIIEDEDGSFWIATSVGLYHYVNEVMTNLTEEFIVDGKGILSIVQDFEGNIWFNSNLRDIFKFDGMNFTKYRISEDDYGPAPFCIYEDKEDRLWFVGYGGAYRYENNKFINITKDGPW